MPKTKTGENISWSEFGQRWKEGINSITPFQQIKTQFYNTWIIVIGIIIGIVFCSLSIKTLWWLLIVLIGALINTVVVQIGTYQKYIAMKKIEEQMKYLRGSQGGIVNYVQ